MSKSEKAFRTITEVAEILELPAHVLRFWESKFKYIKPMKRGGGRRYYRPEDINLLLGIKYLLHSDGLTIKGAQKIIQNNGVKATARLGSQIKTTASPEVILDRVSSESLSKNLSIGSTLTLKIKNIDRAKLGVLLSTLEEIRDRIKMRREKKIVA